MMVAMPAGRQEIVLKEEDEKTAAPVITFFEQSLSFLEMYLVGKIIVPGVTLRGEIKDKAEFLEEAYELGRKLGESAKSV